MFISVLIYSLAVHSDYMVISSLSDASFLKSYCDISVATLAFFGLIFI